MKGVALYDCTADDPSELSFRKNDIIVDIKESKEVGWYYGKVEGSDGPVKLFPDNYVMIKKIPPPLKPKPKGKEPPIIPKKPSTVKNLYHEQDKLVSNSNETGAFVLNTPINNSSSSKKLNGSNTIPCQNLPNLLPKPKILDTSKSDIEEKPFEEKPLSLKERLALYENNLETSSVTTFKKSEPNYKSKDSLQDIKSNAVNDLSKRKSIPQKPKHLENYKTSAKKESHVEINPFESQNSSTENEVEVNKEIKQSLRPSRPAPKPPAKKSNGIEAKEKRFSLQVEKIPPKLPNRKFTQEESILNNDNVNVNENSFPPKLPLRRAQSPAPLKRSLESSNKLIQRKTDEIPKDAKQRYLDLFISLDIKRDGFILGPKVRDVFLRSKLDLDTLGKIWDLCDVRQLGYLDQYSFIYAIYLIDQRLKGFYVPNSI